MNSAHVVSAGIVTRVRVWSDASQVIPVTFTDTLLPGSCFDSYLLQRTWQATDLCGQTVSKVQTIFVNDVTPPTLSAPPADISVKCGHVPPADTNAVTALDNCDPIGTTSIVVFDTPPNAPCGSTITRTWVATDFCGNSANVTQLIFVSPHHNASSIAGLSVLLCIVMSLLGLYLI